jgi:hypothetical protein
VFISCQREHAVLVIALLGLGCRNDARDAHCSPDSPDREADPACIYAGKGSIAPIPQPFCSEASGEGGGGGAGVPASCPTFTEVLNVLADPAKGNCASNGCHGLETTAGFNVFLPIADAQQFYTSLTQATGSVGRPYVVPDDPDTTENESLESWMGCNLRGERGGGHPMPPPGGMIDQTDVEIVSTWLRCGAPAPLPGEGGGGGAGGGDGGNGGSGGAAPSGGSGSNGGNGGAGGNG